MPKGIRGFQKGCTAWNKNLTKETDRRVAKIAENLKGKPTWNKGLKFSNSSEDWPAKNLAKAERGKYNHWKIRGKSKFINVKWKRNMSLAHAGKKLSREHVRKSLTRRTPSSLESKMISIIQKLNLPYKFVGDGKFFIENKNPDFINCNGEKIAIEVFYRRHKQQFSNGIEAWKQERQTLFSKYGWKIIFLDETQVNEENLLKKIERGEFQ